MSVQKHDSARAISWGLVGSFYPLLIAAIGLSPFLLFPNGRFLYLAAQVTCVLPWLVWGYFARRIKTDQSGVSVVRKTLFDLSLGAVMLSAVAINYLLIESSELAFVETTVHPRGSWLLLSIVVPLAMGVPACVHLAASLCQKQLGLGAQLAALFVGGLLSPFLFLAVAPVINPILTRAALLPSMHTGTICFRTLESLGLLAAYTGLLILHSQSHRGIQKSEGFAVG